MRSLPANIQAPPRALGAVRTREHPRPELANKISRADAAPASISTEDGSATVTMPHVRDG
jgi:hypothetical protein